MTDHATPNLPSRNFTATANFYEKLGFAVTWRDESWMILKRGNIILEFFSFPDVDPSSSNFSCCLRLDDVGAFFDIIRAASIVEKTTGWPRAHRPRKEAWGGIVGALIDLDGTLLRLVQSPD